MEEAVKPADNYTLMIGDTPKDIKMTFGLLNQLARTVGDIETIAELSFDIELRDQFLTEILSDRDEKGRITEEVNLFGLDVTSQAMLDLGEWAGAHVTDFLLEQMSRTKALLEKRKPVIEALMPTSDGSPT